MRFLSALLARFGRNEFAKNTAVLAIGTGLAQLMSLAAMPVMSRLYQPADYGLLAVFLAVSNISATVITLRYETAILLPKQESESASLVRLSVSLALGLGLLFATLAWMLPEKLRAFLGVMSLGFWLPVAVLAGMATAMTAIASSWMNRQRAYIQLTKFRITQSFLGISTGILWGLWGYTNGLLLAQLASLSIVAVLFLFSLRGIGGYRVEQDLRDVAIKHVDVPKYLLATSLLDVVTLQLPVLLITAWFSSEVAGQFSMAWKILALPLALVGGAVGQVFLQRFSRIWPDATLARQLLYDTWKILALVGLLPAVSVMLFGEQIFVWVLGAAWGDAGKMAAIIAPMIFAMLISSPTSGIFLVMGLQRYSLIFGVAFVFYRSACIYIGVVSDNVFQGLFAWVVCELIAISIYNFIAMQRMKVK